MKSLVAVAVALALFADPAAARDRVVLAPYSNWVMNYDDDSCALQRQFGPLGGQVFFELRSFGGNESMQVIVGSKDFDRRAGGLRLALEPHDQEAEELLSFGWRGSEDYEGELFSYSLGRNDPRKDAAYRDFVVAASFITEEQRSLLLRWLEIDRQNPDYFRLSENADLVRGMALVAEALDRTEGWQNLRNSIEGEVEGILIERGFDESLFLQTGELHAPMEAMRTCLEELYSHWGIDVEAHKMLTRPALPLDYAKLVREIQEDYPGRMIATGMQGYIRVRLDVSAEGNPTACHLQSQINDEAFERVACRNMMRHALFAPALDKQGEPIASFYQTSIVYMFDR
ncbi:MAG TPA: energy transducer TonB [Croceibacterium sp.]